MTERREPIRAVEPKAPVEKPGRIPPLPPTEGPEKISRRGFLKKGAVALVGGAAVAGLGLGVKDILSNQEHPRVKPSSKPIPTGSGPTSVPESPPVKPPKLVYSEGFKFYGKRLPFGYFETNQGFDEGWYFVVANFVAKTEGLFTKDIMVNGKPMKALGRKLYLGNGYGGKRLEGNFLFGLEDDDKYYINLPHNTLFNDRHSNRYTYDFNFGSTQEIMKMSKPGTEVMIDAPIRWLYKHKWEASKTAPSVFGSIDYDFESSIIEGAMAYDNLLIEASQGKDVQLPENSFGYATFFNFLSS